MIRTRDLVVGYSSPLIGPLNVEVEDGEFLTIVGPNGIGKTTLFKTLLGLIPPLHGTVEFGGRDLSAFSTKEFARTAALVPQAHVPPFPYSVRDIVVMGRNPHMHEFSSPGAEERELAEQALERVGLAGFGDRDYTEVSGGERQLVLIARALIQEPKVLLMDEPSAHLDFGNSARVLTQVRHLAETGMTVAMITHSPEHALWYSDNVLVLGPDNFTMQGPPADVLSAEVLSRIYSLPVTVARAGPPEHAITVCLPSDILTSKEEL